MKRCYVASPCGFTESGRVWYNDVFLPAFSELVEVIDPWCFVTFDMIREAQILGYLPDFWLEVGIKNFKLIQTCELMVANLDGEPPDTGTVAEVGFAHGIDIPIIAYRSDLRTCGEEGMATNLMLPAAVKMSGGIWTQDLLKLRKAVAKLAGHRARD